MGKTVTVGKYEDPNDKYPEFVEGQKYLMKVLESPKEQETDNFQRTAKVKKWFWKLECIDPQQPNYIGKTNLLITQYVPSTDMRNKLTCLLMATVVHGAINENMSVDLDTVLGKPFYVTFKRGKEKDSGGHYENVVTIERAGDFASNAPIQPGTVPAPLPPGWQQFWNAQSGKFQYLNPSTGQWQWESPPVQAAPPPPMQPIAPPPVQQPPQQQPPMQQPPAPAQQPPMQQPPPPVQQPPQQQPPMQQPPANFSFPQFPKQ
jgi:hypothetical protein